MCAPPPTHRCPPSLVIAPPAIHAPRRRRVLPSHPQENKPLSDASSVAGPCPGVSGEHPQATLIIDDARSRVHTRGPPASKQSTGIQTAARSKPAGARQTATVRTTPQSPCHPDSSQARQQHHNLWKRLQKCNITKPGTYTTTPSLHNTEISGTRQTATQQGKRWWGCNNSATPASALCDRAERATRAPAALRAHRRSGGAAGARTRRRPCARDPRATRAVRARAPDARRRPSTRPPALSPAGLGPVRARAGTGRPGHGAPRGMPHAQINNTDHNDGPT